MSVRSQYLAYHLKTSLLICIACCNFIAWADDHNEITLVLAAEMPSITDPTSGKYAELASLLNQQRSLDAHTFFFFGGGSIGPSALSNLDRGSHIIDILNNLEPDAMGVAKRDYSYFEDELSLRAHEALFPIITTNAIDKRLNGVSDGLVQSALITKGNIKIGFVSIVNERLITEYLLTHMQIVDPAEAILEQAMILRKNGADLIILHHFYPFPFISKFLERAIIDLSFVSNSRIQTNEKRTLSDNPRILLLDYPGTALLAKISITAGKIDIQSVDRIALSSLSQDLGIKQQVDAYTLRLNRLLDDQVGVWDDLYSTRREDVRSRENEFANYVADAMRAFNNADMALINSGSFRGDTSYKRHSPITRRTIASELPFRSTLKVVNISGRQLLQGLEVGFAGLDDLKGTFPQVSGLRVVFDSRLPPNQRVVSVTVNNEALREDQIYTLATTDYLLDGGDGYASFKQAKNDNKIVAKDSILISDLVLRAIRKEGILSSNIENRIVDEGQAAEPNS